jgi:hypothetical protein
LTRPVLVISQNLVLNPGFETTVQCPDGFTTPFNDQVANAAGWSSYSETPDYFHVCGTYAPITIPSYSFGYQLPHSGNAYCGGATYNKNALYRETIGRQLASPLIVGERYYVSFYTCLSGAPGFTFATNMIGAKFTTLPHNYITSPIAIDNIAQVYNDTLISDTLNWKLIHGSFIADSAYAYISIGNFFDDLNTDTFCINNAAITLDGYYYIDDVCVSTDSLYAATWTGIKDDHAAASFTMFPNPADENVLLEFDNSTREECVLTLYDIHGQVVQIVTGITEGKIEIERQDLPAGLYFFRLYTTEKIKASGSLVLK